MSSPFAERPEDAVGSLGELGLLAHIRSWLGAAAPPPPAGMGDDTAVLPDGTGNLLTTDSLVYRRHFDDALEPARAGAKLLKRNLSDLAAMGGQPGAAVLAGFLPPQTSIAWLEGFVRGLAACALEWNTSIVGGDLTETDGFFGFNLTLTGHAARPRLRGEARVGDDIWISGELGGSLAGHHADFIPRLAEGAWLATQPQLRAMIDVTDGLGKDLPALVPEHASAVLDLTALPLRVGVADPAAAFVDGEDYELLFTAESGWRTNGGPEAWASRFATRLTRLGTIVDGGDSDSAPLIDAATGQALTFGDGYAHFG